MRKKIILFAVLFSAAFFALSAQEEASNQEEQETEVSVIYDETAVFIISDIEFDIKGRTRPYALIHKGEFKIGETFTGKEELDNYVSEKTQVLVNQRVLKDNVVIDYSIEEQLEDETFPVILYVKVEDTLNIIVLPRPAYNSNTGFELTIKARDYNFIGTMNSLRVDVGYRYDENKNHSFQFEVYSDTPFRAFGYTWNVRFDNLFWYRPNVEEPFFYENVTGISMELPYRATTFTFGFDESLIYNEENDNDKKEIYGVDFQKGLYMSSNLFASWKIPTSLMVHRYGELTYTPAISAVFNHELPKWPLLPFRKGPFLNFSHSLGFERIDWISNFRDGLSVFINNSYTYDFYRSSQGLPPLSTFFSVGGSGYFILANFFSITSQLQFRHWFYHDPDYYDGAGDILRGIGDRNISADYMLSLNLDFPFRLFVFRPSKWLNKNKLRFFDFELQLSPILDLALYHDPAADISFHPKNIAFTSGLELFVFPLAFRSLYIRFGYAINMRKLIETGKFPSGDDREIYLIMRHFY